MSLKFVNVFADSVEKLAALDRLEVDAKFRAARRVGTRIVVPALADDAKIEELRSAGYEVEIVADADEVAAERSAEVPRVNRFASARDLEALEERTVLGYLTVAEIDAILSNLAALHGDLVTLLPLPHRTWESRTVRAVRLRAGTATDRAGVLVTGGMHAREWGGADICIALLNAFINAYRSGAGVSFGAKSYSASQIANILERLDLFFVPLVNPDGREFSQTSDVSSGSSQSFWWRKNRNPNGGAPPSQRGVDLNRNFDFLWTSGIGTSTALSSSVYRGAAAFSEPETRNVRHLLDTYGQIRYYVDIHSHGELILYSWGDDDNQTDLPQQNFRNPAFDGTRGVPGDALYREFIPSLDETTARDFALRMRDALATVRGRSYTVEQASGLYPTSGTSDDYAYSRHRAIVGGSKVYAYTIEFGNQFVPPSAEMANVKNDVCAALTELCWAANSDVLIRDNPADTGAVPSSGPFWNSPDVWVRNANDGIASHENPVAGRDNHVYVRVTNRGVAEASPVRVRVLLANFIGTEFRFPEDYVPRNPGGGGSLGPPGTYLIGDATISTLPASSSRVVNVRWPASLVPATTGWHPCLLVQVSPDDGKAPRGPHVWESGNLGQKNLTIATVRRKERLEIPFLMGSPFSTAESAELVVDRRKLPLSFPVALDVEDPSLHDLIASQTKLFDPVRPVIPPRVTLLDRTTVALPSIFSGPSAVTVLRLPERMELSFAEEDPEPKDPTERDAECRLESVEERDGRKLLQLQAPATKMAIPLKAGVRRKMTLVIDVPHDADEGEELELNVVQRRDRTPVGGAAIRLRVK